MCLNADDFGGKGLTNPAKPEPRVGRLWNFAFVQSAVEKAVPRKLRIPQAGETPTPPWLRSQRRSAFLRSSAFPEAAKGDLQKLEPFENQSRLTA